eukprot:TRINITY_DN32135_c0_g1_i1.p1 TRINITY_DN32135_c0_g1~~TRINITY_DN32135_c0_g1_i1.p1  ORF type:complete len:100 (+),score=18.34 TRINITY_DN32135_c0_g1_i1:172-471(+)
MRPLLFGPSPAAEYGKAGLRLDSSGYVVTKEWEKVKEGLLVRGAGQTHVGGHQIVHNTSQVRLQGFPPVLNKPLRSVPTLFLGGKYKELTIGSFFLSVW